MAAQSSADTGTEVNFRHYACWATWPNRSSWNARQQSTVGDNRIQHNEVTLLMLLSQVLQAGLNMHLATSCNHVLAAPLGGAHPLRVQLEELLQAFDELWQLLAILDLDSRLRD